MVLIRAPASPGGAPPHVDTRYLRWLFQTYVSLINEVLLDGV